MVDKINSDAVLEATSPAETVQRLIPVPVKDEAAFNSVELYKECLTPECDC